MAKISVIILSFCMLVHSCKTETGKKSIEKWKNEILETEQNFAKMAGEEGIHKAFTTYAADDAVLMRNDKLIVGLKNISLHFKNQSTTGLSWKPDFVDVSALGDLGYTHGHYTFSFIDSTGKAVQDTGIFHTVWKRQSDGKWRFVWD